MDATGSVTRDINKYVDNAIKKYAIKGEHSLKDSEDFVNKMKDEKVKEDEELISFDVVALYPSVPHEEAINLVQKELEEDTELHKSTTMSKDILYIQGKTLYPSR